jgi:hypothetical protein
MNKIHRRRFLSTSIVAVVSAPLLISHSWAKEDPLKESPVEEKAYNPSRKKKRMHSGIRGMSITMSALPRVMS